MSDVAVVGDERRTVLICHNAKAGGRDGYRQILRLSRLLAECGFEARIETDLTALPQRVDQAQSQGRLRAVVGAGGDGTMAALANLLPPGVPLIPMPMGTENLLAKHLGQAGAPGEVSSTVQSGTAIEVDAGRAGGKLFLLMISAGLDAEIVRRFEQRRGARSGRVKASRTSRPDRRNTVASPATVHLRIAGDIRSTR